MTYTLGGATSPNTTWGSYWNALGTVQSEGVTKTASQMMESPLFMADSDQTDVFDFGGAVRIITIEVIKDDTAANLTTFTQALMTLIQGDQSPDKGYPIDYVSDLLGTVKVKIQNISFTWIAGEATKLGYTIKMIESSSVG